MEKINTEHWTVDKHVHKEQIAEAAALLRRNEAVAFPTETVYGLGANALSDEAVGKIFAAKGRPSDNPLIVHIAEQQQLDSLVQSVPKQAQRLIDAFWPGPLTVILPKGQAVAEKVTAGLPTVAVRMPAHPVALALIKEADLPIAAPSANLSGQPSPTSAEHVRADLEGRIAGIIDGGVAGIGVESTVVDCSGDIAAILRPGGVTKDDITTVIGDLARAQTEGSAGTPKSPGMKYRHYAPEAAVTLVDGSPEFLQSMVDERRNKGRKVGVLTTVERQSFYRADAVVSCGTRSDLQTVARGLYDALRAFDDRGISVVFSETFSEEGVGEAVMNRLLKSSGGRIITQ